MIGAMKSFASSVYQSLPELPTFKLDSPKNMIAKIQKLAVPTILLLGTSYVAQQAEAFGFGTLACVLCLAGGGGPVCVPPCVLAMVTAPIPGY